MHDMLMCSALEHLQCAALWHKWQAVPCISRAQNSQTLTSTDVTRLGIDFIFQQALCTDQLDDPWGHRRALLHTTTGGQRYMELGLVSPRRNTSRLTRAEF